MESWESDILIRRRYDLINKTDCTPNLIAKLVEKKVLSKDDKSSLTVKRNLEGQEAQSDALYTTVEKKVNGFRILIGALIEVDQLAPAKILIEEANKLGKGNGLPQLPPEAEELSSSATDAARTQPEPVWLPKDLKNFVENGLELDVHVKQPDNVQSAPPDANDMYSLPPKGRGYAFILNIIEISGQEPRLGAKEDTKYMIKLLKGLGYKIFPDKYTLYTTSNWNKEQIITELEKFKTKCIRDRVDSIVVYAGSHGYENTILTADGGQLNIDIEIINKLQIGFSEVKKRVAKIFINQSCQLEGPIDNVTTNDPPDWDDTICIKAQMPKYPASRDPICGSYFVIVLVYVLMNKARDTSLMEMLEEVQKYMKIISEELPPEDNQMSPFTISGLKKGFYFFTKI